MNGQISPACHIMSCLGASEKTITLHVYVTNFRDKSPCLPLTSAAAAKKKTFHIAQRIAKLKPFFDPKTTKNQIVRVTTKS